MVYFFSSTKLEKRTEHPGREAGWGEREEEGVSGEEWPKQCIHM
jgi:hypothetical protein